MTWTKIPFGKHAGKTLPQVAFGDPDYIYWALEEDIFKGRSIAAELTEVGRKGKRIKIPADGASSKKVRYYIDRVLNKLANVEVIDADQGAHVGSSGTRDSAFFDLSMPRKIATYDKTGGKFVVSAVKYYVFGKKSARMTKERCEEFFDDPTNFG
ncbi:hypothetical protein [Sphingomonas arenae]|uniref:exodeoxyribonuclease X C-terminal domain-containing protein n=1 Tax=Sphingomonas arenae TaxID=2812555 RepID=UPI0019679D94|nr:hypothetical protein [Sphingomonas arenae]